MRWSELIANSGSPALSDGHRTLSYQQLQVAVAERANWLSQIAPQAVAIELSNGIDWVLFDMACAEAGIPCIPIPTFFSAHQRQHVLSAAGVELVITEATADSGHHSVFSSVQMHWLSPAAGSYPRGTAKITFTSGSTGEPKGVCLSMEQQLATARALLQAIDIKHPVHLAILPLATLLENIAGVYTPLLGGGTVYVPGNDRLGFVGSRLLEPQKLLQTISGFQPDTLILVPELLQGLVNAVDMGWAPPSSLQFIAVGGARVAPTLLARACDKGLPVYQGYGLSECSSVVALNTPAQQREGSIGTPLSHVKTAMVDGELVVSGNPFLGYLHDRDSWYPQSVATGDLVTEDGEGFFWFQGRRRNQIISSFGRNISPEWPESELLSDGLLRQAVVMGDDRPHCVAVVSPYHTTGSHDLATWLEGVNQRLPDYARVKQCLVVEQPLSSQPGLFTDNGRPNRAAISKFFAPVIDELYRHPEVAIHCADLAAISQQFAAGSLRMA